MRLAAHEFGHILGIDDAYPSSDNTRPSAAVQSGVRDIMSYYSNTDFHLTGWDLALALHVFMGNKFRYWMYYSGYRPSNIFSYYRCST